MLDIKSLVYTMWPRTVSKFTHINDYNNGTKITTDGRHFMTTFFCQCTANEPKKVNHILIYV